MSYITDKNEVVYDIVSTTEMTVKISELNKSKFKDKAVVLEIPATVYDASTNTQYAGAAFSVTDIAESAFDGCSLLTEVSITAPIPSIPNNAFRGCSSLEKVNFPANVTKIGSEVPSQALSACGPMPTAPSNGTTCRDAPWPLRSPVKFTSA